MSESEKQTALVSVQPNALTKVGAKSLVARGCADLRNNEEAEEWLKRGVEFYSQQRYDDAFSCFEHGIELNPDHSGIQFMLGLSFGGGFVRPMNIVTAREWYRKAAEQGHKGAQYNLGLLYYGWDDGPGLQQNYEYAASWFRKAAEQGLEKPSFNTSAWPPSHWFRMAAEQELERAQSRLDLLLGNGIIVPQNQAEVYKAAECGNKDAQFNLGLLYENGQGVPQDYTQAEYWYRMAADQGNSNAKDKLREIIEKKVEANRRHEEYIDELAEKSLALQMFDPPITERTMIVGCPVLTIPDSEIKYPNFLTWWTAVGRLTPTDAQGWSTLSGPGVMKDRVEMINPDDWAALPKQERELIREWTETWDIGLFFD